MTKSPLTKVKANGSHVLEDMRAYETSKFSSDPHIFDAIASFLALPPQAKEALPSVHSQGFSRGSITVLGESGLKGQILEWKVGLSMGYESSRRRERGELRRGKGFFGRE